MSSKSPNNELIHSNQYFTFRIRHFAGTVTYSVGDFVQKNTDFLPRELSRAMFRCDHSLMPQLFPEGNPKRCNIKRPLSKSAQLRISLTSLLKGLSMRQMHYIRCLKPNELKIPRKFEVGLVQHQVGGEKIKNYLQFSVHIYFLLILDRLCF